jgi:hypothetical protein
MAAVAQCFVDSPASHVDDAIDGLLMANPQLVELDGRHTHTIRVIMRRDWDRDTTSHVALISGGGSGHEPAVSMIVEPCARLAASSRPHAANTADHRFDRVFAFLICSSWCLSTLVFCSMRDLSDPEC